jgi:hypothetical protein
MSNARAAHRRSVRAANRPAPPLWQRPKAPVTEAEEASLLAQRDGALTGNGSEPAEPFGIATSPGCDDPEHVQEVRWVVMRMVTAGDVDPGAHRMNCGCALMVHRRDPA